MISAAPAIQAALITLFSDQLTGVQVTLGSPVPGPSGNDLVVGDIETNLDWRALGANPPSRTELIAINCEAGVVKGPQMSDATTALWALLAAADAALKGTGAFTGGQPNMRLGLPSVVLHSRIGQVSTSMTRTDNTPLAKANFKVNATARITT